MQTHSHVGAGKPATLFIELRQQPLRDPPLQVVPGLFQRTIDKPHVPALGLQFKLDAVRQFTGLGQAVGKHKRIICRLDDQRRCANRPEEVTALR